MAPKLSPKQARFCEEILVDENATAAAIRAGYSARGARKSSSETARLPHVKAHLAKLRAERAKRTETTSDYVTSTAREVVERCMVRAPVMVRRGKELVQKKDDDDNDVWQFDSAGALGGLNLLAKLGGMFPKPGASLTVNANLDDLTDEQLEHIANGGALDGLPR